MARSDDLLSIGKITRAHGLRGEVKVRLTTNRVERVAPGSVLWIDDTEIAVEASRPSDQVFLVRFAGVGTRELAEELVGLELFATPLDDPDELWIHELVGAIVVDDDGIERGTIESVEANPASDLLVLDTGALVPARFVDRVDGGRAYVTVPEGLFEL